MREFGPTNEWKDIKRLLCVRMDSLGDVLMTGPAVRALKRTWPAARLTLLTSSNGVEAAHLLPEIDEALAYDPPWMKPLPAITVGSVYDRAFIERLRALRFDAAVIFTVYSQSALPAALTCYLAEIPLRLAYSRENPYRLLTHWMPEIEPQKMVRHEVRRQLDLVASIGAVFKDERMRVTVRSTHQSRMLQILKHHGVDRHRPVIVIHPGASASSRRYPPESFAEVARQLIERRGFQVLLTGTKPESELIESIRSCVGRNCISLAGRLGLGEFAALLRSVPLLISNNTASVHLASSVGTPVIDLYALTNPQHAPWMVPNRVLFEDVPCRYCYKSVCPEGHGNCLRQVTPDRVLRSVDELLAQVRRRPRDGSEAVFGSITQETITASVAESATATATTMVAATVTTAVTAATTATATDLNLPEPGSASDLAPLPDILSCFHRTSEDDVECFAFPL